MVAARSSSARALVAVLAVVAITATAITAGGTIVPDPSIVVDEEAAERGDGEPVTTGGTRNVTNATVMVAPDGKRAALSSRAAIRRAQRDGWLTASDTYAKGDTFVLRLTAPGIAGVVAKERGRTDEERFESFLARPNTSLMLSEKRPGPSYGRVYLYLDAANVTTVVADPDNDTYYVATDLMTLPWSSDYDEERSFSDPYLLDEEEYVPRFVVDGHHRLNPGDISEANRTGQFTVFAPRATVAFSNETALTVQTGPAPNQAITGYTNVAPGSTLTVRLYNGSSEPFPVTGTGRVTRETPPGADSEANRFRATVDLSGADPGTEFLLEIRTNGTQIGGPYEGYVDPELAPTATPTPSPTATPTTTDTPTRTPTATATPTPHLDPAVTPTETRTPTTPGTTSGDGPGFGAVAALLGLLALVAFGVPRSDRRRR